jgi:hypothetical protein
MATIEAHSHWIPAFAGMTVKSRMISFAAEGHLRPRALFGRTGMTSKKLTSSLDSCFRRNDGQKQDDRLRRRGAPPALATDSGAPE